MRIERDLSLPIALTVPQVLREYLLGDVLRVVVSWNAMTLSPLPMHEREDEKNG